MSCPGCGDVHAMPGVWRMNEVSGVCRMHDDLSSTGRGRGGVAPGSKTRGLRGATRVRPGSKATHQSIHVRVCRALCPVELLLPLCAMPNPQCPECQGCGECMQCMRCGESMTSLGCGECMQCLGCGKCMQRLGCGECMQCGESITSLGCGECMQCLGCGESMNSEECEFGAPPSVRLNGRRKNAHSPRTQTCALPPTRDQYNLWAVETAWNVWAVENQ